MHFEYQEPALYLTVLTSYDIFYSIFFMEQSMWVQVSDC